MINFNSSKTKQKIAAVIVIVIVAGDGHRNGGRSIFVLRHFQTYAMRNLQ